MDIIISPYVKISEHDNYTVYQYPKNYLELFLDELFYDNSIEVTDDFTFKISINGFILNKVNIESMIDFEYLRQKQIATYWVSEWYNYLIENVPNTMITFKSKLIRLTDNDIADLSKFKINNIIPDSLAKKNYKNNI
ncbi:putative cdc123-like protein [Megavirus lba]|uniref:Putative cdc123-like protein n=1 Tax=Megavirus lba TaxID=1235314 RepID=L7Y1Q9_9VIRU|nr:putative cdc123-like protein [Megavirus lba]